MLPTKFQAWKGCEFNEHIGIFLLENNENFSYNAQNSWMKMNYSYVEIYDKLEKTIFVEKNKE